MSSHDWQIAFWVSSFLVPLAAAAAAVSNAQYQRVREVETQQALAREARAVLAPEVTGNLELIATIEGQLGQARVPLGKFQTAAWQTVSAGELMRGFRGEDLARLAGAYELAIQTNNTLDSLLEYNVGIGSAMQGASSTRQAYSNTLSGLLNRLRAALTDVQTLLETD